MFAGIVSQQNLFNYFIKSNNFKMNLGTAITGAIFIAVFMLPFIFMLNGRKKKEKQLLQSILSIANNYNCKISKHEVFDELAIGLDESSNQLLFYKKINENEIIQHINLAEIKSCKIINSGAIVNNKEGSYKSTEKLDLHFSFLDAKKPDILMEFFNAEENLELSGEIQLIEKWSKIVNDRLNYIKN